MEPRTDPEPSRLARWLASTGTTQDALARQLGTTGPVVCRWAHGARIPSPLYWRGLERLTGIPAGYWLNLQRARLQGRRRAA